VRGLIAVNKSEEEIVIDYYDCYSNNSILLE